MLLLATINRMVMAAEGVFETISLSDHVKGCPVEPKEALEAWIWHPQLHRRCLDTTCPLLLLIFVVRVSCVLMMI